uniref:Adenylate cyclase n=2 Tax=Paracidobacterium acidisoli TaxID=2303751 RepID=A0A372IQK9_9BACT
MRSVLQAVLESAAFRASKQSQRLLQYLVEQIIEGQDEGLKERIVGNAVFGRTADYDTGDDPIVRVRAADVRRRLTQYYASEGGSDALRIEIHTGAYRPIFVENRAHADASMTRETLQNGFASVSETAVGERAAAAAAENPSDSRSRSGSRSGWLTRFRFRFAMVAVMAGTLAAAAFFAIQHMHRSALDQFWAPALKNERPVLIYMGANAVYRLSEPVLDRYRATHDIQTQGSEFFVNFPPGTTVPSEDIVPARDFVMGNDVNAVVNLTSVFIRKNKPYELRWGRDISPGDLRYGPVVLVGAFNNNVTLEATSHLRFMYEHGDRIQDQFNPKQVWSVSSNPDGSVKEDYAVITRLVDAQTHSVFLVVGGIGDLGTEAASEFLSDESQMNAALHNMPPDWSSKNIQILLNVRMLDTSRRVSHVVSVYVW